VGDRAAARDAVGGQEGLAGEVGWLAALVADAQQRVGLPQVPSGSTSSSRPGAAADSASARGARPAVVATAASLSRSRRVTSMAVRRS
jgi:hypothetical protein